MIFEKIKEILVEQLGVDENDITMEASFIDDLGADSLDIVELIMAMEEEFDIESPKKMPRAFQPWAQPLNISKQDSKRGKTYDGFKRT